MDQQLQTRLEQEEVYVDGPSLSRTGKELKELLTGDVATRMSLLWRKVAEEDYSNSEEEEFLAFELLHYQSIVSERLTETWAENWWHNKRNACDCCRTNGDPCKEHPKLEITLPYEEKKRLSEQFRSLFFLVLLELSSLVTDILFLLFNLIEVPDLFLASLLCLSLAVLVRLCSSLYVASTVDWKNYWFVYVAGVLVSLFETNSGLALVKRSLLKKEKEGQYVYYIDGSIKEQKEKDLISVLSRNNIKAGWAELRNILSVTLMEDIPQSFIQFIYLTRQRENLDLLFFFALFTTILHIIMQWIEGAITYWSIRRLLHKLKNGREVTFNEDGKTQIVRKGLTRSLNRTRTLDLNEFLIAYNKAVRKVDVRLMGETFSNLELRTISTTCKNLVSIDLAYTSVTDEGVISLASHCRNLVLVRLGHTVIGDPAVRAIAENCKNLTKIELYDTKVSNEGVTALGHDSVYLDFVNLGKTKITDESVIKLAKGCKDIRDIYLEITDHITDETLYALADNCKQLSNVYMENTEITDDGVIALGRRCPKLNIVDVSKTSVSDQSISFLAQTSQNLRKVYLMETRITDEAVKELANNRKEELVRLGLQQTSVTDESLFAIAENCRKLEWIFLMRTAVTDAGVVAVAQKCNEALTKVDLRRTEVTDKSFHALATYCDRLRDLYIEPNMIGEEPLRVLSRKGVNVKSDVKYGY